MELILIRHGLPVRRDDSADPDLSAEGHDQSRKVADWLAHDAEPHFTPDPAHPLTRRERKHRKAMVLERWFGLDLSHKHYRLVA